MDCVKAWTLLKRSSKVLLGAAIGASLMCGAARFPILVEVNWGTEESRIKFDSRSSGLCEVTKVVER